MIISIQIAGILLLFLAILHLGFPWYFKWKTSLSSLTLLHKQVYIVHTFFIGFILFLMGILCAFHAPSLISSTLGKVICLGLGIFWLVRLYVQFFVYSSKLWKGKLFETWMHILFSVLWIYLTLVFILAYFM